MKDEINKQNRTGFFRLVYIVGDFGGTFYFSFKWEKKKKKKSSEYVMYMYIQESKHSFLN